MFRKGISGIWFVVMAAILALAASCGEPENVTEELDGEEETEYPAAVDPPVLGEVFDFETTVDEWQDHLVDGEPQLTELTPDMPFQGIEVFLVGDAPSLEFQIAGADGDWGPWQEFTPQGAHADMYGGVVNLDEPAAAFRFRSHIHQNYIRFEFFEDRIAIDEEHHHHSHDEESHFPYDDDEGFEDEFGFHLYDEDDHDDEDDDFFDEFGLLSFDDFDFDDDFDYEDEFDDYDDFDYDADFDEDDDEDLSQFSSELRTVKQGQSISCNKRKMAAYSNGTRLANATVIRIGGKNVELKTASAYDKMRRAAARSGVGITISSGFRTMSEQQYFYNCYLTKRCNGGNLAARPGYSNHQNGWALDLNTSSPGVYNWMSRNASKFGFVRTVPSEPWHWEYRSGVRVKPQLCSKPPPRFDVRMRSNLVRINNSFNQGSSRGIQDAATGERFRANIFVRNRSNRVLRNVQIGYQIDRANLEPVNYRIQVRRNGKWVNSGLKRIKANPDKLGRRGTIRLRKFNKGQAKRVVIYFQAKQPTTRQNRPARIRTWLRNVNNVYEVRRSWTDGLRKNRIGRRVHAQSRVDVFSRNWWVFRGNHRQDLEGWSSCPRGRNDYDRLRIAKDHPSLAMRITGDNACLRSPAWTAVNANRFDELVIRLRTFGGPHQKTVFWRGIDDNGFNQQRSMTFDVRGDGTWQVVVIPLGENPLWKGPIRRLRIDMLVNQTLGPNQRMNNQIGQIFFQSSTTLKTTAPHLDYRGEAD